MPAIEHSIALPVRFAETDAMGVVHHSVYLIWFEAARVAWMDAVGLPYTEVAAGGHHFAVTGAQCEYRRAARFGDTVRIAARLAFLHNRQVHFAYEVRSEAGGALLARGRTEHVCVDLGGRMTTIPPAIRQRLAQIQSSAREEEDAARDAPVGQDPTPA